jgi:uncharacterized protein YcbK (DUF882 family)
MAAGDWKAIKHFLPTEFAAPEQMGVDFVFWLDTVRETAGVPMHLSSSYRTPAHNKAVGGAADSAHCDSPCNAVDIAKTPTADDPHWNVARGRIVRAAYAAGCVRVGFYPNGALHLDRTEDRRPAALWNAVDVKA